MKKLNLLVSLVLITGVCAFALMHQGGLRLSLSPELTMQKVVVELKSEQPPTEKKAPVKKSAGDVYYQTTFDTELLSASMVKYSNESAAYISEDAVVVSNGDNVTATRSFINLAPTYCNDITQNIQVGYRYEMTYEVMADKDCTYSALFARAQVDGSSITGFNSLGNWREYELKANERVEVTIDFNFLPRWDGISYYMYPVLYSYFLPTEADTNLYVYPVTYTIYENNYQGWNEISWYDDWSANSTEGVEGTVALTTGVTVGENGMSFSVPQNKSFDEPMIKIPLTGFTLEAGKRYEIKTNFSSDADAEDVVCVYPVVCDSEGNEIVEGQYIYLLQAGITTSTYMTVYGQDNTYSGLYMYVYLKNVEAAPADLNVVVDSIEITCDTPDLSKYSVATYDDELDMYTSTDDTNNTFGFNDNGDLVAIMTANDEVTLPERIIINNNLIPVTNINISRDIWSSCPALRTINAPKVNEISNVRVSADCSLERINVHSIEGSYYFTNAEMLPEGRLVVVHSDLPVSNIYGLDNYNGKVRCLIGNETLDAPVHDNNSQSIFYEYDAENDAWIGFVKENGAYLPNAIHSSGTTVRIPEYISFPNDPGRYAITRIYNSYSEFTANAPALTDIYLSCNINDIDIYWSYTTIRNIHFYGEFNQTIPQLRSSLGSDYKVYFPSREMLDYFETNASNYWSPAQYLPEGWEYPMLEVNVARRGEFAQTLLEMTDFNWGEARYVKVTGKLNENDLKNMKEMTNIQVLDISEADFDALPAEWLYNKKALTKVVLPDFVTSIPNDAFENCSSLQTIDLENITYIGNSAFNNCKSLKDVNLPAATYIGNYAFYGCTSLTNIELPEGLTYIGQYGFYNCRFSEVVIPEGIWMIASYAFSKNPNLTTVTLPTTLTRIDSYAFAETGVTSVEIPEGVTTIGSYAYSGCSKIATVALPSTLSSMSAGVFNYCTSLKNVTCKAVVPPSTSSTFTSGVDMTRVTLWALPFAIDAYRTDQYWSVFYIVKPLLEPVSNIVIDRPVKFDLLSEDNEVLANNPSMMLKYSGSSNVGQLTAEGDGTLSAGYFEMWAKFECRNSNYYYNYYTSTLINNAENMRADNVNISADVERNVWHFFSLPYDVAMSNINVNEGTDFVIRRYDSEKRALGDNTTGSNWVTVGEDETLVAGEGYIIQAANNTDAAKAYVCFVSGNTLTKNNIFRSSDYTVTLKEYASEFAQNRSWNFVGNPYPSFYRLNTLIDDFYQPVTIWRGSAYQAYSPIDDDVILRPFEAFFVQCPLDGNEMTFWEDGRMHYADVYNGSWGTPGYKISSKINGERVVFNFNIGGEEISDRARVVFNESAERSYEIACDAPKMFADYAEDIEIYVNDGIEYSICERPFDEGNVSLGIKAGRAGEYTISMDTRNAQGWKVLLTDNITGMTVDLTASDYTFETETGDFTDRFTLSFANAAQGVNTLLSSDAPVKIYNLQGVEVYEGVFGDFRGDKEIYVVVSGDKSYKVQL